MNGSPVNITNEEIDAFERDGAICLRQVFNSYWISKIKIGIEKNLKNPSPYAEFLYPTKNERCHDNNIHSLDGLYFNDYLNWEKIPEFKDFIYNSNIGEIAGKLMKSSTATFYHEHVLIKECGSGSLKTPWHMDQSYYPINGQKCLSFWIPINRIPLDTTLRFVAGSHKHPNWYIPRKFATHLNYENKIGNTNDHIVENPTFVNIPNDNEIQKMTILQWNLEPGDCLVFHMRTIHGANGNITNIPRRILSTRWLGDDTSFVERPWETSPPFTGDLKFGDHPSKSSKFPIIWKSN